LTQARRLAALAASIAIAALAATGCSSEERAASATREAESRPPAPPPAKEAPNIVVITADDQTLETFNRQTMPRTFRLLVDHGTRFDDFIATTPMCCPSRASFITGQYGHNNGVLHNAYGGLENKPNVLPAWLRASGYRTLHIGKYLNGYERSLGHVTDRAPGWDRWFTLLQLKYYGYDVATGNGAIRFRQRPSDYVTSVLTRRATSWLKRFLPRPRPVYLQLDEFAPHFGAGDKGGRCDHAPVPAPGDRAKYRNEPLPAKPSFNEPNTADKARVVRSLPRLDRQERRGVIQRYRCALATLTGVDRSVAAVLKALDDAGELDRTMVVFWSDNGFYYGEHRIPDEKQFPYEEGIHLPLAIRLPASLEEDAPRLVREPVANIDLAPTILDLANVTPCLGDDCRVLDGRSLLPLLTDPRAPFPARRPLAVEIGLTSNHEPYERPCEYSGVRVDGRVLVHVLAAALPNLPCRPVDEYEFYSLRSDPHQLRNIYETARGADRRRLQRMRAMIERLSDCSGIRLRDPVPLSGHYCG
jgi:N-acetylglucosamine-6-sulfatase